MKLVKYLFISSLTLCFLPIIGMEQASSKILSTYPIDSTTANLIVNSDAEAGPGSDDDSSVVVVPGWTVQSNFTAVKYGASGGFPRADTPGPSDRGSNFFAGGPNTSSSSATQSIDLSSYASNIDSGHQTFTLSGYFGGWQTHPDNATLTIIFKNANDQTLGMAQIGPVTNQERSNQTQFFYRTISGQVPSTSRKVEVKLQMIRFAGSYDDGYADNLSLTLNTPSSTIVGEARLDINMPYNSNRGCPSPYTGCDGPYHGFYKGVCTDLVMDSYNAGASFDIQNSLNQDYLNNPGRYRYHTARNAEDMRRYFKYNGSFLPHNQSYEPGDIAFFDWGGDGLTDHVLIISEIDGNNRPLKMVDASGIIGGINSSGLAFEHNWSTYYENSIQGHARLKAVNLASTTVSTETLQTLRVTLNSASGRLSLFDSNGKSISEIYDENLVANNIENAIPYIPGGSYLNLGAQKIITVTQPLSNANQYFVRVDGQANTIYTLLIESLQDSLVVTSQVFTQSIETGESNNIGVSLIAPNGVLSFISQPPVPSPIVGFPNSVSIAGLVGTFAQTTFTISETGGKHAINNASISATDLSTQYGTKILSSQLTTTPSNFSLTTSGTQQVSIQINLADLSSGEYLGGLILRSQSGNPFIIPLTLQIQYYTVYLPSIVKN